MTATHKCYPGSPARTRISVHKLFENYVWRIVIPPWGFFAWLAKADWCKVRFCPWCGEEFPPLDEDGERQDAPIELSDDIKDIAPSLRGPSCVCNHVRLDHWGPCRFPDCGCSRYQQKGLEG